MPTRELPLDPAGDFRPDPLIAHPGKNPADAHGIGQEVTTRLVLAMVISRLDYCNAALAGLSAPSNRTVAPLQRV